MIYKIKLVSLIYKVTLPVQASFKKTNIFLPIVFLAKAMTIDYAK